jgi:hypothetical protein
MNAVLLVLVLAAAHPDEARVSRDVRLVLTTEKDSYLVGEPVTITATFENHSKDATHRGFFGVSGNSPVFYLTYGPPGGPKLTFRRRTPITETVEWLSPWLQLGPGTTRSSTIVLSYDDVNARQVLAAPGIVEFRAVYNPSQGKTPTLLSEPIKVSVEEPSGHDRQAMASFTPALARLAQYDPAIDMPVTPELVERAWQFHERNPHSALSVPVTAGLRRALGQQRDRNKATPRMLQVLRSLEAEQPAEQDLGDESNE